MSKPEVTLPAFFSFLTIITFFSFTTDITATEFTTFSRQYGVFSPENSHLQNGYFHLT